MEMPKPGPEHERLAQLAGQWEGDETLHPTPFAPDGGPAKGRWTFQMAVGGFFLIGDYQESRDGQVNLEGHAVLGWDGEQYFMHWFDSSGMAPATQPRGSWTGDTLVLQHEMPGMGHARYTLTVDDGLRFTIQNSGDGTEWMTFLEGDYSRVA